MNGETKLDDDAKRGVFFVAVETMIRNAIERPNLLLELANTFGRRAALMPEPFGSEARKAAEYFKAAAVVGKIMHEVATEQTGFYGIASIDSITPGSVPLANLRDDEVITAVTIQIVRTEVGAYRESCREAEQMARGEVPTKVTPMPTPSTN